MGLLQREVRGERGKRKRKDGEWEWEGRGERSPCSDFTIWPLITVQKIKTNM